MELVLLRHGKTDWNDEGRVMGDYPIGLNSGGVRQVEAANAYLNSVPFDAVITSPTRRTIETAEIVVKSRPEALVTQDAAWIETMYGEWIGKCFEDIRTHPRYEGFIKRPSQVGAPGGENLAEVQKRTIESIENLRKIYDKKRVLIVSHADVIKVVLSYFLKSDLDKCRDMKIDNGSLSILKFNAEYRVVGINIMPTMESYLTLEKQL